MDMQHPEGIPDGDITVTLKAECRECGETFDVTLPDEADLAHITRADGTDCDGVGIIPDENWPRVTDVQVG